MKKGFQNPRHMKSEVNNVLYIVRAFEDDEMYEYEYGNLHHAEDQYNWEKSAELWIYEDGKETLIRKK